MAIFPGHHLAPFAASVEYTSPRAGGPFHQSPDGAGCRQVPPLLLALQWARAFRELVGEGTPVQGPRDPLDMAPALPSLGGVTVGRKQCPRAELE